MNKLLLLSATMDADREMFDYNILSGNMNAIPTVKKVLGAISVFVISIVGFGIVIFSILKNALIALYAVSPKIWDRVDEAHKVDLFNKKQGGNENQISMILGSLSTFALKLLPNIKALTDADGKQIDIKAYLTKSLCLLCVQVFVGVFVWYGYPAQVANKFSDVGRAAMDLVLENVDPVSFVETLPDRFAVIHWSMENGATTKDSYLLQTCKTAGNTFWGNASFKDMTASMRQHVAPTIESKVLAEFDSIDSVYLDGNKYKFSVKGVMCEAEPDTSYMHNKTDQESKVYTYAIVIPVSELEHGLEPRDVLDKKFIRLDLVFTPKAWQYEEGSTLSGCSLYLNNSVVSTSNGTITVKMEELGASSNRAYKFANNKILSGTCAYTDGNGESKTVSITNNGCASINDVSFTFKASGNGVTLDAGNIQSITGISGLYYNYEGDTIEVDELYFGSGEVKFVADNISWSWGSQFKTDDINTGETNTGTSTTESSGDEPMAIS